MYVFVCVCVCIYVLLYLKTNMGMYVWVGGLTGAEASGGVVSSDERGVGESGVKELNIVGV